MCGTSLLFYMLLAAKGLPIDFLYVSFDVNRVLCTKMLRTSNVKTSERHETWPVAGLTRNHGRKFDTRSHFVSFLPTTFDSAFADDCAESCLIARSEE